MLSKDERYEEDIEQIKYLIEWTERKEQKKRMRKKNYDDSREAFKASTNI